MPARQELQPLQSNGFSAHEFSPVRYSLFHGEQDHPIAKTKEIFGRKGVSLVEASEAGLNVPSFFILSTDVSRHFNAIGELPPGLWREVLEQVRRLENITGKTFGDPENPLVCSVRSSAPVSMPGVMASILNVGLNDKTVEGLGETIGLSAAFGAYFRLINLVGVHAYGIDNNLFDTIRHEAIRAHGVRRLNQLPESTLRDLISQAKDILQKHGVSFPTDPIEQLRVSTTAVLQSWNSQEAQSYRKKFGIPDAFGTAVIVQKMVWGNSLENGAGSGVIFSRDPITLGEAQAVFAPGVQGTAVVSDVSFGERVPLPSLPPIVREEAERIITILSRTYPAPIEVEFTYDGQDFWVLQVREFPLSALAHFRYLQEAIRAKRLSPDEAVRRVSSEQLQSLLGPMVEPQAAARAKSSGNLIGTGMVVSFGHASGIAVSSIAEARLYKSQPVVYVGSIGNEELLSLPTNVVGIVATNGGIGSHIARVATRIGAKGIPILFGAQIVHLPHLEAVTVDGVSGEMFSGILPLITDTSETLLTKKEHAHAERWVAMRRKNPWRYVADERDYKRMRRRVRTVRLQSSLRGVRSIKSRVREVLTHVVPKDIQIKYTVVKPMKKRRIRKLLKEYLAQGYDASVRTSYHPDRRGGTPWVGLFKPEDVDLFLNSRTYSKKYGGYPVWVKEPDLTELIIGKLPKDKLNPRPDIQHVHSVWSLAITEKGEIFLQVLPHTSQTRMFDEKETTYDTIITYTTRFDLESPTGFAPLVRMVGASLRRDTLATDSAQRIADRVFGDWWQKHEIPARMAALADAFPHPHFAVPALEGQARIDPATGALIWCLVYDAKVDLVPDTTEQNGAAKDHP